MSANWQDLQNNIAWTIGNGLVVNFLDDSSGFYGFMDKPQLGWYCLNVDGAISLTQGSGTIGGLVQDNEGNWLVGFYKAIRGSGTIGGLVQDSKGNWLIGFYKAMRILDALRAELRAIYSGSHLSWSYGFDVIQIQSDCQQVVRLVNEPTKSTSPRSIARIHNNGWIKEVIWIP
ncbi:hypothetical protein V6N11_051068 [Hibiscus sabdariffa]|uniref:RNase H type-1 domain-containing protein n=1 Tax=Hibiscus sabdariffa TaxID=183260 RepID=A0ABR2R361_9ROSI